jgi:hypothetical protein
MAGVARVLLLAGLILGYGLLFAAREHQLARGSLTLEIAKPASFYRATSGYLHQLTAEMLFVKAGVYLGGALLSNAAPAGYADALANNLQVVSELYPRFLAPYYYAQAFLPHISLEFAEKTSTILQNGIAAHPEDHFLRLSHAANYFLAMNEPLKGAAAFADAAKLPGAPPLFGRLAAMLSAQGGDLTAGLIMLKTIQAAEADPGVRQRYQEEIDIFEQALVVEQALQAYQAKYGSPAESLARLVPEFLPVLPEIDGPFVLIYDPPRLQLKRPGPEQKKEKGIPWL